MSVEPVEDPLQSRDPWKVQAPGDRPGGEEYAALLEALRLLQDRVVEATPPRAEIVDLIAQLNAVSEKLAQWGVSEWERWAGRRGDLPGRGSTLLPPAIVTSETENELRGRVHFQSFHLGGNGAAHGGTVPLIFDDLLGRLVNTRFSGRARTAYLTVNYRKITPIGVDLSFDVRLDRVEGRKRWASGRILNPAGDLLCDAEGLFVELRPGQP